MYVKNKIKKTRLSQVNTKTKIQTKAEIKMLMMNICSRFSEMEVRTSRLEVLFLMF